MNWIPFPDPRLAVYGLPWFRENSPRLWRLPGRLRGVVRDPVWDLAEQPSGGRIRFTTDATTLGIRLHYPTYERYPNICVIGQMGVDLYVDGDYYRTAYPTEAGDLETLFFEGLSARGREITLYLPLYAPVEVVAVGVNGGASVEGAEPFVLPDPVVYYGSSITQGGCASRGGLSYQAILGRALHIDFVNLGFSGNGRGEPELARAMAEVPASCYVVDFAQNCVSVEALAEVYAPFLAILRGAHPETPILCTTPIFSTSELWRPASRERLEGMRRVIRAAAEARIAMGDTRLDLVEGYELLGPDQQEGFVDGTHPNDLGFESMAAGLLPVLTRALEV
ncbi:MAG: hypothetical protein HY321_14265 [Armatimonadetes bacterium]|nr:hypothetical protein [Armatimonadota bacterium]